MAGFLCIGQAYGISVFNLPLGRAIGSMLHKAPQLFR